MNIQKFHIYLADLEPSFGAEPGKIRPVIVVQTNHLNSIHSTTIICPLTSKVIGDQIYPLRLRLKSKDSGLMVDSDILIDQIRAIDNRRFRKHVGSLPVNKEKQLMEAIQMLLFE